MSARSLLVCGLVALIQPSIAGYALTEEYNPSNFFSKFSFFTTADPTHGLVKYVDQGTAQNDGLIQTNGDSIYMGVDHNNNVGAEGRPSVRITSSSSYNHGLVIVDIAHMPEGCGTWPAFWMVGDNWPNNGEIDIIEGVNSQNSNQMTLHTGPGCSINSGGFSGSLLTSNCDVNAAGQSNNAGCGIKSYDTLSYGTGFNNNGGGVYATQWTSQAINIWFFPRNSIPSDVGGANPNPSSWGQPSASFQGGCDIDSSIKNQQIVFDTTFCGDWAGNVWGSDGQCSSQASSCQDYVMNNPGAFANAYWKVNSLKIYQDESGSLSENKPAPSGVVSTLSPAVSTLAPIPDGHPLTALSWLAHPSQSSGTSTSVPDLDATVTLAPSNSPLTAVSWQAPTAAAHPIPVQFPAPQAQPSPLTALSWPATPSQGAALDDTSKQESNDSSNSSSNDDGWKPGDALESDFFGVGSQGIPVDRRDIPSRTQRRSRRRAAHLLAHQKGVHAGHGHGHGHGRSYARRHYA